MQDQPSNEVPSFAPVCNVCKTQDASLRAVTYPFVVSVIIVTFQRAFSGIFCAKHQRRYHLLASLITSTVGWLGIPYGLFLTPLTLSKLARGGLVHAEPSLSILSQLAEQKLRAGDTAGAIRCLEESLKLQDSPPLRERLSRLYQQRMLTADRSLAQPIWQFLSIPILLIATTVIGFTLGFADTLVIWLLMPLFGDEVTILVAILSWLPTVLFLFSGVLIARALLRWSLHKLSSTSILLGSVLSFTCTSFLFYSMLEGRSLLRNLEAIFTFFSISMGDGIFTVRSLLSHGGIDVLLNDLSYGLTGTIFVVLWSASVLLSLFVGMEIVVQISQWQSRLQQIRQIHTMDMGNSSAAGWMSYGAILFAIGLTTALIYPGRFVNMEKAYEHITLGTTATDQYHYQEAMTHFRQVANIWPDSVTSHMYMGLGYSSLEKFEDALRELDTAFEADPNSSISRLFRGYVLTSQGRFKEAITEIQYVAGAQPQWGLPHAFLAALYYNLDEQDQAQEEIETAIQYQSEDAQTISFIGAYYSATRDFEKAEEYFQKALLISNDSQDHLYLARVYTRLGELEKAQESIEAATRLGADPVEISLAKSGIATAKSDLNTAEALIQDALKVFPDNSQLWAEISYIHFEQGKIGVAIQEATKAVELNPYNSDAYLALAFAYHAQGNRSEAMAAAQKSLALYPQYDRVHYILGLCYKDQSMNEQAITEFETFLKLYWDRPLAREYKRNAEAFLQELK